MAKLIDKLSVFLPAYNEEQNIKTTTLRVQDVLEKVADSWEIIIINDGSTDGTLEAARALVRSDKRIRLINHQKNLGYGATLKSGLYGCRYPWIAFIDSDGQFDFSEITKLIEKQEETKADLVAGYYLKRQVPFYRKANTFLWQMLVYILFGLPVRDIDCGFKLIAKRVIDKIPKLESERGAFISTEFLVKAKKKGFRIVEAPVTHYPRTKGFGTGANLNVIIQSFMDLFKLWRKLG